jgi:hypothetical protein
MAQAIPFNNIASIGMIRDLATESLPADDKNGFAWTDVQNCRFKGGSISKMGGYEELIDTSTTVAPYFYTRVQTTDKNIYLYAGLNKIYGYYAGSHYNLTRQTAGVDVDYSASLSNQWVATTINFSTVLNNGFDTPQAWVNADTGVKFVDLPAWPTDYKANILRAYKNYLIAADITDDAPVRHPNRVQWSTGGLPGELPSSWDPSDPEQDAGYQDLADSEDAIVDMLPLGDANIIYKNTSTYLMQYVGGNKIFSITKKFPNVGMLNKNCAVPVKAQHIVLTNDDVIIHDGFQYKSIIDNKNKKYQIIKIEYKFC